MCAAKLDCRDTLPAPPFLNAVNKLAQRNDVDAEVAAALSILQRLPELASNETNLPAAGELVRLLNVRLFLGFRPRQIKRRVLNKLAHGIITFGEARSPVPLYEGPTGRRASQSKIAAAIAASPEGDVPLPDRLGSGREDKSLGNVNRGNCPSFEPLIAAWVDAVLSPSPETVVAMRVARLSA